MGILSCFCMILILTQPASDGMTGTPVSTIVFEETFDRVTPPALPPGWRSSTTRSPGTADLSTTASSPSSAPNAVLGSNATIEQWLVSCPMDRATILPATLSFALRRSSTFTARCVVEASTDGGTTFSIIIGEAPVLFSSSAYQTIEFLLPPALSATDSFTLRWHFLPSATGTTGTVRLDDVRLLRPRPAVARSTIVVNEIQHQPPAQQPEWIEVFHAGSDPVDIAGWSVSDAPAGTRHVLGSDTPVIQPGTYVLITADSILLRASTGSRSWILQPEGFPSLNNSGDLVLLMDEEGRVMDSLRYDVAWGGGPGLSIERIDPLGLSTTPENWGSSTSTSGATPGYENSIVIRPQDLRLKRFLQDRSPGTSPGEFRAVVVNAGSARSGPFGLCLRRTGHGLDSGSVVASIAVSTELLPGDSVSCICIWTDPPPGTHHITAEILWREDARAENDTASAEAVIPILRGTLRINEIQATPIGGSAEFIEIINTGTAPVSLTGCMIADRPLMHEQVRRWPVTSSSSSLPPGGLHVVAGDSSVLFLPGVSPERCMVASRSGLGLNNDGDTVLLYGADSVLIDSVVYSAGWHSAIISDPSGRSLERYHPGLSGTDPRNWGTCVDPAGSTPGRTNSILLSTMPSDATLACAPDPFSPDGDGSEDVTVLRYRMPLRSSLIRIRVFDIRGRCVRELVNVTPAGMTGEVVWDGAGENRVPLRMGIYIVHLEAIDDAGGRTVTAKCAVVLARRL
jgi:hypothetical protein